jgi:hypothetical protein
MLLQSYSASRRGSNGAFRGVQVPKRAPNLYISTIKFEEYMALLVGGGVVFGIIPTKFAVVN